MYVILQLIIAKIIYMPISLARAGPKLSPSQIGHFPFLSK